MNLLAQTQSGRARPPGAPASDAGAIWERRLQAAAWNTPGFLSLLRAWFENRPVRGPGLHDSGILAISCRPHALTRRLLAILKHVLGLLPFLLATTGRAQDAVAQDATVAGVPSFAIAERGPNRRIWTNSAGGTYTELATGMHFLNNGQWVETQERIQVAADGSAAYATQGPSQAIFSANANSIPCIDLLTPDSKRLQSHVLGLAYYDAASGKNVMIAETKDAVGQLLPPNQILYPDAMTDFTCDIMYTYRKCGLEQDIILRQQPPPPQSFGLDPASTRLQVWTEFFDPPTPRIQRRMFYQEADPLVRQAMAEPDWTDDYIDFDALHIGLGQALSLDGADSLLVLKEWLTISNRTCLVESLSYSQVKPLLDALPLVAAVVPSNPGAIQTALKARPARSRAEFVARLPKSLLEKGRRTERMQTAMIHRASPRGVTLDYSVLASATNFTFKGDTTYYVSGTVNLSATTTFEGGSVIKYAASASASISLPSNSSGSINWLATSYRPVIFTSISDDTVGEVIPGSTGNPSTNYCGNGYLNIVGSTTNYPTPFLIQNVRFAYAKLALSVGYGSGQLRHAQLVNCQSGLQAYSSSVSVYNALCFNVLTNFWGSTATFSCQNLTSDTANYLQVMQANSTLSLVNCLLTSVTNVSYYSASYTSNLTSSAGVYQTVGAGAHYLAPNSPYRNVGTTSIDAALLSDLRKKTTYPPGVLTNDFTVNTTLAPLAARDTDTPALGWHYDVLDYVWTQLNLTNATLLLTNGVAIGFYGTNGTRLLYGAQFISEGTPTNLCRLVRYPAVQELSIAWGPAGSLKRLFDLTNSPSVLPTINLRFTDLSLLAGDATILDWRGYYILGSFILRDSQNRGGFLDFSTFSTSGGQTTYGWTNNYLERATLDLVRNNSAPNKARLGMYLRNNLFRNCSLLFNNPTNDSPFEMKDNLFDTVDLAYGGAYVTNSYNAYYNTTAQGSNSKTLAAVDYQTGPLGNFYYPTNGTNLNSLRDAGSVTNAGLVGLYHYTTTTNQVREGSTPVDIGAHFVALNAAGNPVDSDNDGLPDYFENTSGTGVVGAGETDYLNPDTDYDGRNDYQEFLEGTNPLDANSFTPVRLGYWRFNTNTWASEEGSLPLLATNVSNVAGFDRNSLQINNTNVAAILKYRTIETNALVNFTPLRCSIRFWYRSFWQSKDSTCMAWAHDNFCGDDLSCQSNYCAGVGNGPGPGDWVRLFEVGKWTADSSIGLFALSIDPYGTNLVFQTQDGNGHGLTNLQYYASVTFSDTNHWHEVILTYDSGVSSLTIDGGLVASASGSDYAPRNGIWTNAFSIGSSTNGSMQAQGMIDELEIYNHLLGPIEADQGGNVLGATVSASPPSIQLGWRTTFIQQGPAAVYRRPPGSATWTTLSTNIPGLTFTDTNVAVGSRYEYQYKPLLTVPGYILSGINATPIDYRGKVILLVDQTLTNALATNLTQLTQDLVGDGWKVIRHDAPRHDDATWANNTNNIAVIKGWITNDYNADPTNTKAIYVLGHVSIPYSGWINPDGHFARPWPCDGYYGDIDGNWTDSSNPCCQTNGVYNVPNDGVFDQNSYPTNALGVVGLELGIGRVDFANMPIFGSNAPPGVTPRYESDLLKQYLDKTRRYRQKLTSVETRTIVTDVDVNVASAADYTVYPNADRNNSRVSGLDPGTMIDGDLFYQTNKSYLLGLELGYGNYNAISGVPHTSANLTYSANEPQIGFYLLGGSFFGDWHYSDDLLRAVLGTPNYGFGSMYEYGTRWDLYPVGLGETMGAALQQTVAHGASLNSVDAFLLGDPTLRLQMLAPPSNVSWTTAGSNVSLTWNPSPESGAQYWVYRSTNGVSGDFLRLTAQPLTGPSYTDSSAPSGQKTYEVRALNTVITGSGSFTNVSNGIFTIVN